MVELNNFLTDEEDVLLAEIHERTCDELRELIEDYLVAVKEEVDGQNLLKDIVIGYNDINIAIRLPADRQKAYETEVEKEVKKSIPTDMFI